MKAVLAIKYSLVSETTAIFFKYGLTVENSTLLTDTFFLAREGAVSGEKEAVFISITKCYVCSCFRQ